MRPTHVAPLRRAMCPKRLTFFLARGERHGRDQVRGLVNRTRDRHTSPFESGGSRCDEGESGGIDRVLNRENPVGEARACHRPRPARLCAMIGPASISTKWTVHPACEPRRRARGCVCRPDRAAATTGECDHPTVQRDERGRYQPHETRARRDRRAAVSAACMASPTPRGSGTPCGRWQHGNAPPRAQASPAASGWLESESGRIVGRTRGLGQRHHVRPRPESARRSPAPSRALAHSANLRVTRDPCPGLLTTPRAARHGRSPSLAGGGS